MVCPLGTMLSVSHHIVGVSPYRVIAMQHRGPPDQFVTLTLLFLTAHLKNDVFCLHACTDKCNFEF